MTDVKIVACSRFERQLALLGCDYIIRRPDGTVVSNGNVDDLKVGPKRGEARAYALRYLTGLELGDECVVPYTDEFTDKILPKVVGNAAYYLFGKGGFATTTNEQGVEVYRSYPDEE